MSALVFLDYKLHVAHTTRVVYIQVESNDKGTSISILFQASEIGSWDVSPL